MKSNLQLGIHPLIDIRLWEKTEGDKDISFAKNLTAFAREQKSLVENVTIAIRQEKLINQDIHQLKGKVSSNIGLIIEEIINEEPDI